MVLYELKREVENNLPKSRLITDPARIAAMIYISSINVCGEATLMNYPR
jgi:hypothetical protein